MEENRQQAEKLKLKEKADELSNAAPKSKKPRKKVFIEDTILQFDREYVPGHDSLSEEEDVYLVPQV